MAQVGEKNLITINTHHFSAKNVISVTAALYIDLDHLKKREEETICIIIGRK
jgi:hypothetical protein